MRSGYKYSIFPSKQRLLSFDKVVVAVLAYAGIPDNTDMATSIREQLSDHGSAILPDKSCVTLHEE